MSKQKSRQPTADDWAAVGQIELKSPLGKAKHRLEAMKLRWERIDTVWDTWEVLLTEVANAKDWELLGYASLDAMLAANEIPPELALSRHGFDGRLILGHDEAGKMGGRGNKAPYDCKELYGNGTTYLTARLARDFPDTLAEVKQGKYRSIHAAAKAVGIVNDKPRISVDGADMAKAAALLASRLEQKQLAVLISELVKRLDDDQLEWIDDAPLDTAHSP